MEPYSDPLVFSYTNTESIAILAVEHALKIQVLRIENTYPDRDALELCMSIYHTQDPFSEFEKQWPHVTCVSGTGKAHRVEVGIKEAQKLTNDSYCFGHGVPETLFKDTQTAMKTNFRLNTRRNTNNQTARRCPTDEAGNSLFCVSRYENNLEVTIPEKLTQGIASKKCRYIVCIARFWFTKTKEKTVGHQVTLIWDKTEKDVLIIDSNGADVFNVGEAVLYTGIIVAFNHLKLPYSTKTKKTEGWTISQSDAYTCQLNVDHSLAGSCQIWSQISWKLYALYNNKDAEKTLRIIGQSPETINNIVRSYIQESIRKYILHSTGYDYRIYTSNIAPHYCITKDNKPAELHYIWPAHINTQKLFMHIYEPDIYIHAATSPNFIHITLIEKDPQYTLKFIQESQDINTIADLIKKTSSKDYYSAICAGVVVVTALNTTLEKIVHPGISNHWPITLAVNTEDFLTNDEPYTLPQQTQDYDNIELVD